MRAAMLLRGLAIAIAVLGVVDPPLISAHRPMTDADLAVPRGGAGGNDGARRRLAAEIAAATAGDVRWRVREFDGGDRLPCAADVPCVVITDPVVVPRGGFERRQPLITIGTAGAPDDGVVTIEDVVTPPARVDEPAAAMVTLSGTGLVGRETTVDLRDGDVPVGSARYAWGDAPSASVRVPWWPARAGQRRLTAAARTSGSGGVAVAETLAVDVDVAADPMPVLVLEPRASWAVTFVRRALEADPRLAVDSVAALAPGLATARGGAVVDDARVERARVVVAGGLEAVSSRDVARFARYLEGRGGALVLVPDAAVAGPVTSLLPGRWRPRLDPKPSLAGGLRASEWLLATGLADGDVVLAAHDGQPAIVSRAVGEGRMVVVGALDAWRHRAFVPPADPGNRNASASPSPSGNRAGATAGEASFGQTAFARAWQDLVADLARGTAPLVDVQVTHSPGDDAATVDVQVRALDAPSSWSVAARAVCGGDAQPVRLWPQARAGHFRGRAAYPRAGTSCDVVAAVTGRGEARAMLMPPPDSVAEARRTGDRLRVVAAASGGVAAAPGDTRAVAAALAALRPAAPVPTPEWPMRSWWWGLAAGLALGGEWWLRRRAGAR